MSTLHRLFQSVMDLQSAKRGKLVNEILVVRQIEGSSI